MFLSKHKIRAEICGFDKKLKNKNRQIKEVSVSDSGEALISSD